MTRYILPVALPSLESAVSLNQGRPCAILGERGYLTVAPQTMIVAMRAGKVTGVRWRPDITGMDERGIHNTNLLYLSHGDGTYALYRHIRPFPRRGSHVVAGEPLGIVMGYASGTEPHLHVDLFQGGPDVRILGPKRLALELSLQ